MRAVLIGRRLSWWEPDEHGNPRELRPDRRLHLGGDRGRVRLRRLVLRRLEEPGREELPHHLHGLRRRPVARGAGQLQRLARRRGDEHRAARRRPEPSLRHHRRQRPHPRQDRHAGAARGDDRHGGRLDRAHRGQQQRGAAGGARGSALRHHLRGPLQLPEPAREGSEPVHQGRGHSGEGRQDPRRECRLDHGDGEERRGVLARARRQFGGHRPAHGRDERPRQDHRAARAAPRRHRRAGVLDPPGRGPEARRQRARQRRFGGGRRRRQQGRDRPRAGRPRGRRQEPAGLHPALLRQRPHRRALLEEPGRRRQGREPARGQARQPRRRGGRDRQVGGSRQGGPRRRQRRRADDDPLRQSRRLRHPHRRGRRDRPQPRPDERATRLPAGAGAGDPRRGRSPKDRRGRRKTSPTSPTVSAGAARASTRSSTTRAN